MTEEPPHQKFAVFPYHKLEFAQFDGRAGVMFKISLLNLNVCKPLFIGFLIFLFKKVHNFQSN